MPDLNSSTGPTPDGAETSTTQLEQTAAATAAPEAQAQGGTQDPPAAGGEDAKAAQSSSANGVKQDQELDLAAVVRNAAKKQDPVKEAPKSPDGAGGQDTSVAPKPDAKADAQQGDENVPFAKHPRWQEVLRERNGFRKEVEALKPQAEEWGKVTTFMEVNRLTPEEVAQGFQIMALIKHDPVKALQALTPYIEQMETITGKRLPADLQKQVDEGHVTQEVASELSRTRAQNQALQQNSQQTQQQLEAREAQQRNANIQSAVVTWEQGIAQKDPDYKLKQSVLRAHVRAALADNRPATAEEALKICQKAYEAASEDLKPILAKRQPTPANPGSSNSSTRATAVPQTLRDVVRQASGSQR